MLGARARGGVAVLAALALLAAGACTSDDDGAPAAAETNPTDDEPRDSEPPPPAGLQVAVILPDQGSVDAAVVEQLTGDVRRLGASSGPEIGSVRAFAPGEREFVADIAWELVGRNTDLTCVLGRYSRSLVAELAEFNPQLAFCAAPTPTNAEVPEGVHAIEIRSEELGHVVGVAAAGVAEGGTIGLVLGTETMPRGSFREGVTAGVGGADVVSATVDEETDATAAVEQVLAEGAEVVVLDNVAGASEAIELAAEQALVLAPEAVVRGTTAERTVLTWRVHWDVVLAPALDRLINGGVARHSFGFPEGAFSVALGEAAPPSLAARVDRAITALEERERDPLEPPSDLVPPNGGSLPRPSPDEDDADDDAGAEPADDAEAEPQDDTDTDSR